MLVAKGLWLGWMLAVWPMDRFKALVVDRIDGSLKARVRQVDLGQLPDGAVTIAVEYSTLNHQDAMIMHGLGQRVARYPHVPGCDLAGVVESSRDPAWPPGSRALLTGWKVGADRWGGLAQRARVKPDWLMRVPEPLTTRQAMGIGTPGLTAMLAIAALEQHGVTPDRGDILITGTPGGVGSMAVVLLSALGYRVVAAIAQPASDAYVRELGAAEVVERSWLARQPAHDLEPPRWAGCIDSAGGGALARALAEMAPGGTIAAVGLSADKALNTTTLPFIVRGVNLIGIHSDNCPVEKRAEIWERIVRLLPVTKLEAMIDDATLEDLPILAGVMLEGRVSGRIVVDVNA